MESRRQQCRKESWSELPVEITRSIAKLLEHDPSDIRHFRMVCKNWRRSTAISALLPWSSHRSLFYSSVYLVRPPAASSSHSLSPPWIVSSFEATQGMLEFRPLFSRTLCPNLPQDFNLANFHSSQLAASYHYSTKARDETFSDHKMLVSPDESYFLGVLKGGKLMPSNSTGFDDIVRFRGMLLALDRLGKLYQYHRPTRKCSVFLPHGVSEDPHQGWRKRLVTNSAAHLFLVVRQNEDHTNPTQHLFKLYELSDSSTPPNWVEVKGFGDRDQVLFVARDYCFFANTDDFPGCQLRNCMVYSDEAFPRYSKESWVFPNQGTCKEESVAVFQLGGQGCNFQPASLYPGFPTSLLSASPPLWVLQPKPSKSTLSVKKTNRALRKSASKRYAYLRRHNGHNHRLLKESSVDVQSELEAIKKEQQACVKLIMERLPIGNPSNNHERRYEDLQHNFQGLIATSPCSKTSSASAPKEQAIHLTTTAGEQISTDYQKVMTDVQKLHILHHSLLLEKTTLMKGKMEAEQAKREAEQAKMEAEQAKTEAEQAKMEHEQKFTQLAEKVEQLETELAEEKHHSINKEKEAIEKAIAAFKSECVRWLCGGSLTKV